MSSNKSEANIQREIMLACSEAGITVWRNNTAQGWQGDKIIKKGRDVLLINARPIKCGLCVGSADLIGIKPVIIQQSDVGKTMGIFTAIEVKRPGKEPTEEQDTFLDHVYECGGIAVVGKSTEDIPT